MKTATMIFSAAAMQSSSTETFTGVRRRFRIRLQFPCMLFNQQHLAIADGTPQ
jgi:hypothetical protein